jgi:hypothetical protein
VDAVVAAFDPACRSESAGDLDDRATADLARILAGPAGSPAAPRSSDRALPRSRRALTLGVASAAIIAVITSQQPAPLVATPTPLTYSLSGVATGPGSSATDLLLRIAGRAQALGDDVGKGAYAHVVTEGWYTNMTDVGDGHPAYAVVPQRAESWRDATGTGTGTLVLISQPPGEAATRNTVTITPEDLAWPLGSLSADDRMLSEQLALGNPPENGPHQRLVAITDAYRQEPHPGPVRAAMLRYLAATPGLSVTGTTTDRGGRQGLAFSLVDASQKIRHTLIIDPRDGRLLSTEDRLVGAALGASEGRIAPKSVLSYTVFVTSSRSDRRPG